MKIKNKIIGLSLVFIAFAFFGCESDNEKIQEEINIEESIRASDILIIDTLLDEIKPDLQSRLSESNKFEYVSFEIVKNFHTGKISIENIEKKEFFPIGGKTYYNRLGDAYQVDCDLPGEDNDWSDTCDGKFSCGSLVYDCLEAGGCATICQNERSTTESHFNSVKVLYLPKR